ncbi:uncharacterized F-box/LRR-repeat protein C02F5.7 [Diachasma alloeum]|uniref:uncharacterized F-box/LRR-repeat protein C02F5.7 n=1 Tax=Diachasma alloeum TaxID=454923 RepID=UPI0007383F51|nr:uncharacterized F-box/LRR-repeat protein C02F5.7 [Diachasma alloeum]XP_015108457.1 uncharacterized F-box/LRR-repeat protein C02F5.7 [Diachasma alloeum]XP_015108458.1 uncharacterized F-box/LRR-repeat protein C02F5.7 [Diachasma alloeum]
MAPVKVIVQGIPMKTDNPNSPQGQDNDDKTKLEKLFSVYGPVQCRYLWSDASAYVASSPFKRQRMVRNEKALDNFAHILFKNPEDAARACEAAGNHQIKFDEHILTLTPVSGSLVSIQELDDHCLIKIFSLLETKQRLELEEVCKRWQKVAKVSWSDVEELSLKWVDHTDEDVEKYLTRCGEYLKKFECKVVSPVVRNLILKHCKQMESLDLEINWEIEGENALTSMFKGLRKLKSLTLDHTRLLEFRFLQRLPKSMEHMNFFCSSSYNRPFSFDFRKFTNLRSLSLSGYVLYGQEILGIENMENLTELDFTMSSTYRYLTRKFQFLTNLKVLKIPQSGITDDILMNIIRNNPALEELDISEARAITDSSVRLVSMLEHLKELNVSVTRVTLTSVGAMPSLESLSCQECRNLRDHTVGRLIEQAPNLSHLDVAFTSVTPAVFTIASEALKKRANSVSLELSTDYKCGLLDGVKDLSPLLRVDWDQCRHRSIYGDNNYSVKPLNDECPEGDEYLEEPSESDEGSSDENADSFDDDREDEDD